MHAPAGGGAHALPAAALAGARAHAGGAGRLRGPVPVQGAAVPGGDGVHPAHAIRALLLAAAVRWCVGLLTGRGSVSGLNLLTVWVVPLLVRSRCVSCRGTACGGAMSVAAVTRCASIDISTSFIGSVLMSAQWVGWVLLRVCAILLPKHVLHPQQHMCHATQQPVTQHPGTTACRKRSHSQGRL